MEFDFAIGIVVGTCGWILGVRLARHDSLRAPAYLALAGFVIGCAAARMILFLLLGTVSAAGLGYLLYQFSPVLADELRMLAWRRREARSRAERGSFQDQLQQLTAEHEERVASLALLPLDAKRQKQILDLEETRFRRSLERLFDVETTSATATPQAVIDSWFDDTTEAT